MLIPPRTRTASAPGLARRIEQHIYSRGLEPGDHLSAQQLADLFAASRTPVSNALRMLAARGILTHEPQRGFFVRRATNETSSAAVDDVTEQAYFAMSRDRLAGVLPDAVTENDLRRRYGLTKAQLHLLLSRVMQEGWIERRAGRGWAFTEILTTSDALNEFLQAQVRVGTSRVARTGLSAGSGGDRRLPENGTCLAARIICNDAGRHSV